MALSVFQSGDADVGNGIGNSNCCSKPNRFARLTAEAEVKKQPLTYSVGPETGRAEILEVPPAL